MNRPRFPALAPPGVSPCCVLDKTFSADYQRLGEVTDKFMAALKKRKEVTNLFTFYAANYPQYELVINNDVAMQKGVSIRARPRQPSKCSIKCIISTWMISHCSNRQKKSSRACTRFPKNNQQYPDAITEKKYANVRVTCNEVRCIKRCIA